jgi:hypothetical protein
MKSYAKLGLDIVIGAVIPILILNNLTKALGAPTAYVIAALVPVIYVLIDTLFITRRFNFITSYIALSAIMNGFLAFWFVDGVQFAIKDTAALIVTVVLFGGMLAIGKPILRYFMTQALNPDTPTRKTALATLMREPDVRRGLVVATLIVTAESALAAAVNFALNLNIVIAVFGTELFNQQVAQVNAITRITFPIANIAAMLLGFLLIFRAIYKHLPPEAAESSSQNDLWPAIEQWHMEQSTATNL